MPQDVSVALEIVAAEPGERRHARLAAVVESGDHGAKSCPGRLGMGGIMGDVGMVHVDHTGGGIEIISALGDGQRHDADRRIGHRIDQRAVAIGDRHIIDHAARDLG